MDVQDYVDCDATELSARLQQGDVSPKVLLEQAIAAIERVNPELNAVVHRMYDEARAALAELPSGPFRGVPMVVKDFDGFVRGVPFTASSRFLDGFIPDHDSEAMARLRRAGLLFLAKTNCPELGIVATTEPEFRGPTRNPWNRALTPGGSSGGSAALVAARAVPLGHGGDGGGSLRIPASYCGLVGLKASRGRVPLGPDWGEAWGGYVQWGMLTRSVRDAAAMLDIMGGPMPGDPYAAPPLPRPLAQEVSAEPGPLRIAFHVGSLFGERMEAEYGAAVERVAAHLETLGHRVEPALPQFDRSRLVVAYLTEVAIGVAAMIDSMARWTGRVPKPDDFEAQTWFLAQVGRAMSGTVLAQAREVVQSAARMMGNFHQRYDLFMCPTVGAKAAHIGEQRLDLGKRLGLSLLRRVPAAPVLRRALFELAADAVERTPNTELFNQTGQPAISLPLCTSADGMPLGIQLAAPFGREDLLVRLAGQLERSMPWHDRRPSASVG